MLFGSLGLMYSTVIYMPRPLRDMCLCVFVFSEPRFVAAHLIPDSGDKEDDKVYFFFTERVSEAGEREGEAAIHTRIGRVCAVSVHIRQGDSQKRTDRYSSHADFHGWERGDLTPHATSSRRHKQGGTKIILSKHLVLPSGENEHP